MTISGAAIAGTISSGGLPKPPEPPDVSFEYNCKATLHEQVTKNEKTCYSSAYQTYQFKNSDIISGRMIGPYILVNTDQKGWISDYHWEGCPNIPTHTADHFFEIYFYKNAHKKPMVSLYVRVVNNEENNHLYATGDTDTYFSKKIESFSVKINLF
ncbi:MAG: hypothetical protein ABL927_13735, partial [Bdellovibrionales bacterium]